MSRRGQLGIVIFILVVVLILAIVLLIIFLNGKDEVRPEQNATVNKTYYNISVAVNASSLVTYELANDTDVLLRGQLFPDAVEEYRVGVEANTTVKLSAWSENYYWNSSTCNITYNDFPCRVGLKQKAVGYEVNLSRSALVIDPKNLTLQGPVLICWSEHGGRFRNVLMVLPPTQKPQDLARCHDFCFVVQKDITRRMEYLVDIHFNDLVPEPNNLSVLVRDFEIQGKQNVGDRNASIWV